MDLRVQKTYRALTDAFTELLEEYRYEEVTVAMLCERATIRRTTFYKHFNDKSAFFSFFVDSVRAELVEQTHERMSECRDESEERLAILHMLIDFLLMHERLMDNIFASSVSGTLTFKICEGVADLLREHYADSFEPDEADTVNIEAATEFAAGGIMRLLRMWWSGGHQHEDKENFVRAANLLVTRTLGA